MESQPRTPGCVPQNDSRGLGWSSTVVHRPSVSKALGSIPRKNELAGTLTSWVDSVARLVEHVFVMYDDLGLTLSFETQKQMKNLFLS